MVVLGRGPERTAPGWANERNLGILLCLGYAAFYGWLIALGHGLPYVMDNNETFSSLWHATNLARFGLEGGYGLTDESYGMGAAAHPYVYTHQGNFPRLYALLLYELGARTAESQILLTTFTVGLAALLLAYRFLARATGHAGFAALACALMFTDYVLVAQWQVATYRVWHLFFAFAVFRSVQALEDGRRWRGAALLLGLGACLFYFELVFAAMLSAAASIYAGLRNWRRPSVPLAVAASLGVGGALAIAALCGQIVLYMGWDNFVTDARYTFVARNQFVSDEAALRALRRFYESNHIVFWYNLFPGSSFRSFAHFVASISYYELQIHTPAMVLTLALVGLGWLRAALRTGASRLVDAAARALRATLPWLPFLLVGAHLAHRFLRGRFGEPQWLSLGLIAALLALAVPARRALRWPGAGSRLAALAVLLGALPSVIGYLAQAVEIGGFVPIPVEVFAGAYAALVLLSVYRLLKAMVAADANGYEQSFIDGLFVLSVFAITVLVLASPAGLGWRFGDQWLARAWPRSLALAAIVAASICAFAFRALRAGALAARLDALRRAVELNGLILLMLVTIPLLFHPRFQPVWQALGEYALPESFARAMVFAAVLLAHAVAWRVDVRAEAETHGVARQVLLYAAAGYAAYAIVFVLSPGYVFSGYRFRLAPFTVFFTDVLVALAVYLAWRAGAALAAARGLRGERRWGALAAAPLALYWAAIQCGYVALLPPGQMGVLQALAQPPFKGASFVSNTYAAPVAAYTGQWAYIDEELAQAIPERRDGALRLRTDQRYIWLRDRDNPEYRRPQYFICLRPQSVTSLLEEYEQRAGKGPGYQGCGEIGLVKYARSGAQSALPRAELVAIDAEGQRRYGYEAWAIVRLDWGPP